MSESVSVLQQEAKLLAQKLFGKRSKRGVALANHLVDICTRVKGKEFLVIHNPGGWGSTPLDDLLEWERSIVEGVSNTIGRMGYCWLTVQYFRSGNSWLAHMLDMKEQTKFLFKGQMRKSIELATEVRFISGHFKELKIVLVGVSQGAAFSNAVMRQISDLKQVYSIELGLFFPHMSRRVVTERTLAIDDNGMVPDPMAHRNLWLGFKSYVTAPSRWLKYWLDGHPQKFTYCVNAPGHDYNWQYLGVRRRIEDFLMVKFGVKNKLEVRLG
ncbi:MAG: hypothetical protein HYX84_03660 [Chloroflexi bacterium]|nr:hypothetical protein [Chloroflexota bacterium]